MNVSLTKKGRQKLILNEITGNTALGMDMPMHSRRIGNKVQ